MIDFSEIPQANRGGEGQDKFEAFCRDFLEAIGMQIVDGPGRGADGGRDMIAVEAIRGVITRTELRWLVSAKHHAHTNRSVTDADELDPIGRVRKHKCDGFLGFYSTIVSAGLDMTFSKLRQVGERDIKWFDAGKIENRLVGSAALRTVLEQYFPISAKKVPRTDTSDPKDKRAAGELWSCISRSTGTLDAYLRRRRGVLSIWDVARNTYGTYACRDFPPLDAIRPLLAVISDDDLNEKSNKQIGEQTLSWATALHTECLRMALECDQLLTRYAERSVIITDCLRHLKNWAQASALFVELFVGGKLEHFAPRSIDDDGIKNYALTGVILGTIRGTHVFWDFVPEGRPESQDHRS